MSDPSVIGGNDEQSADQVTPNPALEILQHTCTFCGTMCHGPASSFLPGQEEGEWRVEEVCGGANIRFPDHSAIWTESVNLAYIVVGAHNASLQEKTEQQKEQDSGNEYCALCAAWIGDSGLKEPHLATTYVLRNALGVLQRVAATCDSRGLVITAQDVRTIVKELEGFLSSHATDSDSGSDLPMAKDKK